MIEASSPQLQAHESLAYAYGPPVSSGKLRAQLQDFKVEELLDFSLSGSGEHVWLYIEKRGKNTLDVAEQLARHAGVKLVEVGYAGLKDRQAVTSQWFSVGLAGNPEPDWQLLNSDGLSILEVGRHQRKLRRGVHAANRFCIRLASVTGDRQTIQKRLENIRAYGVPNYFGEQRFGRGGGNTAKALAWFCGQIRAPRNRHKRGLYLSAARAYLFNLFLAARVASGSWLKPRNGDVCILDGNRSFFVIETLDQEILNRLSKADIHVACPMWGSGQRGAGFEVQELENKVLVANSELADGLEKQGLKLEYRSTRLLPNDFCWQFCEDDSIELNFTLGRGGFATSVLREIVNY